MNKKRKLRNDAAAAMKLRKEDGKFARKCGCINHEIWSDTSLFSVFCIKSSKKFSIPVVAKMKEQLLLPMYCNTLCTACYDNFKDK